MSKFRIMLALLAAGASSRGALGQASFTFQGQLRQEGIPVSGEVDLQFYLFDSDTSQTPLAGPLVFDGQGANHPAVEVSGGLFAVELDFGTEALQQGGEWLEIHVRSPHSVSGSGAYTAMSPRQHLTAAPFALSVPGLATDDQGVEVAGDVHASGEVAASAYTSNSPLVFKVNPLQMECARFEDQQCYLGLGTDNPQARLHVGGIPGVDGIMFPDGSLQTSAAGFGGGDGFWSPGGANIFNVNGGNVGVGTTSPNHKLRVSGGPTWTSNGWIGALELDNASAIAWRSNAAGQRFGLGHTNTGLAFFRTASDPGTATSPANYDMFINDSGLVGMGTLSPNAKLTVARNWDGQQGALELEGDKPTLRLSAGALGGNEKWILHVGSDGPGNLGFFRRTASPVFPFPYVWNNVMTLAPSGNVGIGTTAPASQLDIAATGEGAELLRFSTERPWVFRQIRTGPSAGLQLLSTVGLKAFEITANDGSNVATFLADAGSSRVGIGTIAPVSKLDIVGQDGLGITGFQPFMTFRDSNAGNARARIQNAGGSLFVYTESSFATGNPPLSVLNSGRVKVNILEIGGADVSEKFPCDAKDVKPGTVMEIDPGNTGKLRISNEAYSPRVAGVVSGAGDIPVGAVLGNLPGHEDAPAIALSGRVWVRCDADSGAIVAGDLLTTSSIAGHAMKATDRDRSHGAVLGKAMTSLPRGERGLVLVLVNLQ